MTALAIGPADLRDQRWLDERVEAIEDGIEAVLDIARNWTDGRNLARLHAGTSAKDYILARVKSPLGPGVIVPLLAESNWSHGQIAAVAGVTRQRVSQVASDLHPEPTARVGADGKTYSPPTFRPRLDPNPDPYYAERSAPRTVTAVVIDEPREEAPIDPVIWYDLGSVMDQIEALMTRDAAVLAAAVPDRRRPATARRIRKLGTFLGRIAWTLEGQESPA